MSSGKLHSSSTMRNGIIITCVCMGWFVVAGKTWPLAIAVGAWVGHILTPDIDHHRLDRRTSDATPLQAIRLAVGGLLVAL